MFSGPRHGGGGSNRPAPPQPNEGSTKNNRTQVRVNQAAHSQRDHAELELEREDNKPEDDAKQMDASFTSHVVSLNSDTNCIMLLVQMSLIVTQEDLDTALSFGRAHCSA